MRRTAALGALGAIAVVAGLWAVLGSGTDVPTPGAAGASAPSPSSGPSPLASRDTAHAMNDTGAPRGPMPIHYDINHVLSTGQSLSVGVAGRPVLSTTQPYANLMFATGVIPVGARLSAFAPLVEGTSGGTHDVETMHSAFANLVTRIAEQSGAEARGTTHDVLVSAHGVSGTPYSGLKKGTDAFASGIAQVKAAMGIAEAAGKSYVVRAVTNVHGESDHTANNPAYERDLAGWQSDYESDVKAITHQREPIPMFQTQMSSWTRYGQPTSIIPAAQLAAHLSSRGKIVLVGPKYHLAYAPDGVHLTNDGYRQMGEDYAKVYRRVVLERASWEPLRPTAITRNGETITVKLLVPVPPIVLDDKRVSNPGNYGFEVAGSDGAPLPIASVTIKGPDTIVIALAAPPSGPGLRLRYAFTGVVGAAAGPATGPRGNLRDSDTTPSLTGHELYNWCIHFDEAVP